MGAMPEDETVGMLEDLASAGSSRCAEKPTHRIVTDKPTLRFYTPTPQSGSDDRPTGPPPFEAQRARTG